MTKAEIVSEIAKSTGIDRANVLTTVEKFMEVVKDSMINGENVYLRKHYHHDSRAQDSRVQAREVFC